MTYIVKAHISREDGIKLIKRHGWTSVGQGQWAIGTQDDLATFSEALHITIQNIIIAEIEK